MTGRIKAGDEVVKIDCEKLDKYAKQKGYTYTSLAELIDKSHSYLTDVRLKGKAIRKTDEKILALAVGLKPGDLILGEDEPRDMSDIISRMDRIESKIDTLKEVLPAFNEEFDEVLYKLDAVFESCMNKAYLEEPEIKKAGEFLMNLLNGRAQGVGIGEIWEQARKRNIAPASLEKARKGLPICQRTVGTGSAQKTRWYIDR